MIQNSKNFEEQRGLKIDGLIKELNPKIKGIVLAYRTIDCTKDFRNLDNYIFTLLIKFLRREHKSKSWKWIVNRYFKTLTLTGFKSNWTLKDPLSDITLLVHRYIPKVNYSLVRSDMCKYYPSPNVKRYWEKSQQLLFDRKLIDLLASLHKQLSESQNHICSICNTTLFSGERLQRHHIIERTLSGKDLFSNFLLIHAMCHNSINYGTNTKLWRDKLLIYKKLHPKKRTIQRKRNSFN